MVYPRMKVNTIKKRKTKNMILAIEAAPAAIPVKPKIAATTAITRNMTTHFNIIFIFIVLYKRANHFM